MAHSLQIQFFGYDINDLEEAARQNAYPTYAQVDPLIKAQLAKAEKHLEAGDNVKALEEGASIVREAHSLVMTSDDTGAYVSAPRPIRAEFRDCAVGIVLKAGTALVRSLQSVPPAELSADQQEVLDKVREKALFAGLWAGSKVVEHDCLDLWRQSVKVMGEDPATILRDAFRQTDYEPSRVIFPRLVLDESSLRIGKIVRRCKPQPA